MIETRMDGEIATLTMAHGKANAMDVEMCRALIAKLDELRDSPARAVVLTGSGNIFSAGVDLHRLLNGGAEYVQTFLPVMSQSFEALFFFPKPVIAAINGHAIAGGCILACACDHRIMARGSARVGIPELPVGVPFPAAPLEIVRFVAAPQHVQGLLYGGALFSAEESVERGLVDALVAPEQLLQSATDVARTFASRPPGVFEITKRQVRYPVARRLREDGDRFDVDVRRLWASKETLDSIRAYVERTIKKS